MGMQTWDTKTQNKKFSNLKRETGERNGELGWWQDEKPLILEKNGKRNTKSLNKATWDKTSQPGKETREET